MYALAQTFFADPKTFNNSTVFTPTSIDIFFRAKPGNINTASGIKNPGASIAICQTVGGIPDLTNIIGGSIGRKEYDEIYALSDGSVATTFSLNPITLKTGVLYAFILFYDDPSFDIWTAKTNSPIIGTNKNFNAPWTFQGQFFRYSSDGTWRAQSDEQATFNLKAAKYTSNSATIQLVNRAFEFLITDTQSAQYIGGEYVYIDNVATYSGTLNVSNTSNIIRGTNTHFTNVFIPFNWVVVQNGTQKQPLKIIDIASDNVMTVAQMPYVTNAACLYWGSPVGVLRFQNKTANTIWLSGSSATANLYFAIGNQVRGEYSNATCNILAYRNKPVNEVYPELKLDVPPNSFVNLSINYANNGYNVDPTRAQKAINGKRSLVTYDAIIMPRSVEVQNPTNLQNGHSEVLTISMGVNQPNTNLFESPTIIGAHQTMFIANYVLNNDVTNEFMRNGNAISKHITTISKLAPNQKAEDLIVYVDAFRPLNTNIYVYAKLFNSADPENFEQKDWTLLQYTNNTDLIFSGSQNDIQEFQFGIPNQPPTDPAWLGNTVNGGIITTNASSNLIGVGTNFSTDLAVGNMIKIYQGQFPDQMMISTINSITNNTLLTITEPVTNSNILGGGATGFATYRKLHPRHAAFLYGLNSNVVMYYNNNLNRFPTYDSYQLKVVFTASNTSVNSGGPLDGIVPFLTGIRAIAVSA
jgi:hypothetical protein